MKRTLKFVDKRNEVMLELTLDFRVVSDIAMYFLEKQLEYLDKKSDVPSEQRKSLGSRITPVKKQFILEDFNPHVTVKREVCQIKLQESLTSDEFITLGYSNYLNEVLTNYGVIVPGLLKNDFDRKEIS